MDLNTVRYWHKLEHFYPYILEEQHNDNIKTYNISNGNNFPEFNNINIPDNKVVRYYEVYFGIFEVDSSLKIIAQQLDSQKEFMDESDDVSCFCKFRLAPDGTFDKKSFKISSFPWAVQRVQNKKINIEAWDEEFHAYELKLFMEFFEAQFVITYQFLFETLKKITNEIGWEIKFSDCWMRIDRVIGEKPPIKEQQEDQEVDKTEEEIEDENKQVDELIKNNDLLNSFYVRDLERIVSNIKLNNYGTAVESYVEHNAERRVDIEENKEELFKVFNPNKMPYGKWPSGYSLRSMQQVAVNLSMDKKAISSKLFSVNGPPGTGKTTLLRDIISANIVERALILFEFNNPNDVFTNEIGNITYKGYKSPVKDIDSRLKKYSMVVASNNNAAVKNITMELPEKSSIKPDYRDEYTYFNEVSDRILDKETWGVCAAALGKKANCFKFIDEFWPLKSSEANKFDFNVYLRKIHTGEKRRTSEERQKAWQQAKSTFIEAYKKVEAEYKNIDILYKNLEEIKYFENEKIIKERQYLELTEKKEKLTSEKSQFEKRYIELKANLARQSSKKQEIKNSITFFKLKYILQSKNQFLQQYKITEEEIQNGLTDKYVIEADIDRLDKSIIVSQKEIEDLQKSILKIENQIIDCKNLIELNGKQYNDLLPTEEFLSNLTGQNSEEERKSSQDKAPWNSDYLNELREKLFLEAMNLHKSFVENSSQMREQLDSFNKMIRGMLTKAQMETLTGALFQSFMLVVPVISTTFASVGTFLKNVGKEEFGLLLIDEAGQALPQSAVGAIWRAKKVIVVGDPLQIDPVVTIHDRTIEFLKQYFKQSDFIACKETSVQSLADEANVYVGSRVIEGRSFYIGSPLLVHGRCQRKIFDIANKIAYNEKMIYGTKEVNSTICDWIDVKGNSVNKHFVKAQADEVLSIIKKEFLSTWEAYGMETYPSLFIISPFRSVKSGMVKYLRSHDFLYYELCKSKDNVSKKTINSWIYTNIGTVHTFQGKEAKTVIFCLGVDSGNKGDGAIKWASSKPNILNVAATRAKENLYIVGDSSKWAHQDYFTDAYEICMKDC